MKGTIPAILIAWISARGSAFQHTGSFIQGDNRRRRSPLFGGGTDASIVAANEEYWKANEVMVRCAKMTALSAAVDFAVDGSKLVAGIASGDWIFPLPTLWKVIFSYNMWRVSKLYKEKTDTLSELYELLENILISMTGMWRRLAFVVSLLTLEGVATVWEDALPHIRPAMNVLYGVVGVISIKLSARETQNLIVERPPSADSRSTQRIARLGRVTVRAMSLGVSAFALDSILTPAIALRKTRIEAMIGLSHLTISIPFAILLWKLRQSYIVFIEDVTALGSSERQGIKPDTQIQLAIAQQNFWGKLKSFQQTHIFFKGVAVIVQLKLLQKLAYRRPLLK